MTEIEQFILTANKEELAELVTYLTKEKPNQNLVHTIKEIITLYS